MKLGWIVFMLACCWIVINAMGYVVWGQFGLAVSNIICPIIIWFGRKRFIRLLSPKLYKELYSKRTMLGGYIDNDKK